MSRKPFAPKSFTLEMSETELRSLEEAAEVTEWPHVRTELGQPVTIHHGPDEAPVQVVCPRCRRPTIWSFELHLAFASAAICGDDVTGSLRKGEMKCLQCRMYQVAVEATKEHGDGGAS